MNRMVVLLLAFALLTGCAGSGSQAVSDNFFGEALSAAALGIQAAETVVPPLDPVPSDDAGAPVDAPADAPVEEEEAPYVRTIDPAKPMVALTFDDGPHKTCTDQILDILEENHAVATFFEVGRNVAYYPQKLQRMVDLGCEIGSHSNAHKNLGKMKKTAQLADLEAADAEFIAAVGFAPTLLRPPYGSVNKSLKTASGRALVTWTIDTLDWKSRDAQTVIDYVEGLENLDGEIVLLHSIYGSTVEAVRTLVPWLQEQGYQLVTVTEILAYYYGELPEPNKLYSYTYFTTHGRTDTPAALPEKPVQPAA